MIIAGIDGKILLMNEAFKTMLPKDFPPVSWLGDLAGAFRQPDRFRESIERTSEASTRHGAANCCWAARATGKSR